MAARKLRIRHTDEIRAKIQASVLIGMLHEHVQGKREMSTTQVRSAEILLRKSVPDLSAVELSGPDGGPIQVQASELTDDQLAQIAKGK